MGDLAHALAHAPGPGAEPGDRARFFSSESAVDGEGGGSDVSAGRSILLVDDDPQLLRLMTRLLEKAGHVVRPAASASEALGCLEDGPPDFGLAILDVNLAAGGGGAEALLPELRVRLPELEVVLISGDALPASLEQTLATRGGRFLRKPFAPSALLALVAESDGGKAGA